MHWSHQGYVISDDPARLDVDAIHRFLSEQSYWARGRSRALVERSLAHSLCLGLYGPNGGQAGFARAVTDRVSFAWLADVFVLEGHRGRGLGDWLVRSLLGHPELSEVFRWVLGTADAQELYERAGFRPIGGQRTLMQLLRGPDPAEGPR
jgi:GNAT superfamily N-acetyltransferase